MPVQPIPKGFRTITPYLSVEGVPKLIQFISDAFAGEITIREERPDGSIMHAEMKVGDSMLMMGEATGDFGPRPASIYLYVPNCDEVYERALAACGKSVFALTNMPSGERYGGVQDPCGNLWWIATHVEDVSPEEQQRRWKEFRR